MNMFMLMFNFFENSCKTCLTTKINLLLNNQKETLFEKEKYRKKKN